VLGTTKKTILMAMNTTQQEQIEAYLDNRLSPEAHKDFERQIAQNEALKKEVELELFVRKGLKAMALKEAFRTMHSDISETPVVPLGQNQQRNAGVFRVQQNRSWFKAYYAAAACLAAVAVGLWYYLQPSPNNQMAINTKLPAQVFLNKEEQTHLLSESQLPLDLSLTPAECEDLFQRYFNKNDFVEENLKNGIEAMQQGKDGLSGFQKIVNTTTNNNTRQKAQWLATLAFLKNCNTAEALQLANSIRQINGHLYQNQAEKLYKRLH
jgi:hypothetical protein